MKVKGWSWKRLAVMATLLTTCFAVVGVHAQSAIPLAQNFDQVAISPDGNRVAWVQEAVNESGAATGRELAEAVFGAAAAGELVDCAISALTSSELKCTSTGVLAAVRGVSSRSSFWSNDAAFADQYSLIARAVTLGQLQAVKQGHANLVTASTLSDGTASSDTTSATVGPFSLEIGEQSSLDHSVSTDASGATETLASFRMLLRFFCS